MSQKHILTETRLLSEVNDIVEKFDREHGSEYRFELFDLRVYENSVTIEIGFIRKFFEISEYVGSVVEQSDCNIENGECERLFEKLYNEELDEINKEYALNINGSLKINNMSIEFCKLECTGDYCEVGFIMNLTIPLSNIEYDIEYIKSVVQQALELMYRLILLYDLS